MATAPSNRRTGTGFINLADWSRANAGAANSLAGRLAGDVDAQGNAVAKDMKRLQSAYDDASDLATINYDDPRGDASRAEYLSRQSYAGPNSLSDVGDFDATLNRADAAESAARRANDYYGRQGALQGLYGQTGAYTPGQQRLDSALAGVAGKERFGALQQRWGNLYNQTQQADTSARQDASRRTDITADAAARYGVEGARLRTEQRARETAAQQESEARELPGLEQEREERIKERREGRNRPTSPKTGYLSGWG